jgi:hypothetical protein
MMTLSGRISFIALISLATPDSSATRPDFGDYRVQDIYTGRPASVDLSSHPIAREYRTRLRKGAAKGPNFAGHYSVVDWGCGSGCQNFAIVDSINGKVFHTPGINSQAGQSFRLDSRLLIMNPVESFGITGVEDCDVPRALAPIGKYFEWKNEELVHIVDVDFCAPFRR